MELMTLWLLGGQHHSVMYKNSVITRRETSMKILSCIVVTCIISVHHIIRKWTYYFQLHKTNNLHWHIICIRCLSERLDDRIQNFSDFIYLAMEISTGGLSTTEHCQRRLRVFIDYESREERRGEEKRYINMRKEKFGIIVSKSHLFSFFFFFCSFSPIAVK